jgi:hypothetical protein
VADTKPEPNDEAAGGPTEELVAYLDGELDPKTAESVATRLGLDSRLRAEADALQRAWDILDVLPRPQPSPAFTTRTLSQVIPVPPGQSGTQVLLGSSPAAVAMAAPPQPGVGFWLGSVLLILVAGVGGYIGHRALMPKPADPALEDVPLMKNLRMYRHVDDVEYLKKLDSPELFGEEAE